jgi:hypothetical protein
MPLKIFTILGESNGSVSINKSLRSEIFGCTHPPMKRALSRVVQSLKDGTECFDDYYPCMKEECELEHVYKWTGLFVFMYNVVRAHIKFTLLTHFLGGDIRYLCCHQDSSEHIYSTDTEKYFDVIVIPSVLS